MRAPPKSQPQVPAPACLPSPAHAHRIHITLLHFFTPAHSRTLPLFTLQPTLPNCCCSTVLSHSLNLSSRHPSLDNTNHHQPIRSPPQSSTHKPHQHHHVSAHINRPARAVLCASNSLIEHQRARTVVKPADPRALVCLSARTAFITTSSTYRHANLIVGDLKSSRLRALRGKNWDTRRTAHTNTFLCRA